MRVFFLLLTLALAEKNGLEKHSRKLRYEGIVGNCEDTDSISNGRCVSFEDNPDERCGTHPYMEYNSALGYAVDWDETTHCCYCGGGQCVEGTERVGTGHLSDCLTLCGTGEVRDSERNCVCDVGAGFVVSGDECQCPGDIVGTDCLPACGTGKVRDANNDCVAMSDAQLLNELQCETVDTQLLDKLKEKQSC